MTNVICSHARQCKQTEVKCYHKSIHEITSYCLVHNCIFNQDRTLYKIGELDDNNNFSCIEIIYK